MPKLLYAIILLCLFCMPVCGETADFEAGKNYHELAKPKKYQNTDKIEVLMILWYGCSGCYKLDEPMIAWAEKLPDDVAFLRVPALFFPEWQFHGQIYMTMQELGATYEQHRAVFDLIQKDKLKVENEADLPAFLAKLDVDKDKFMEIFNSNELADKIDALQAYYVECDLHAVPSMIVNGRYKFSAKDTKGQQFMDLVDHLVNLERNAKAKESSVQK